MCPSRLWLAALLLGLCVGSSLIGQPPPETLPGTPPTLTPPAGAGGNTTPDEPPAMPKDRPIEWPKEIYGKTVQDFITEFGNSDPSVREIAIRTLPSFGPEARKIYIRPLIRLLADPDPGVRINAIMVIGSMPIDNSEDQKQATQLLRNCILQSGNGSALRLNAAKALSGMGPEAISALPNVLSLADDAWWETRQAAAAAVGRIGAPLYEFPTSAKGAPPKAPVLKRPASKQAVEKLLNSFLNDKSSAVRLQAAQSLISLGPPSSTNPQEYIKTVKPWLDIVNEKLKTDNKSEKDPVVRIWLMVVTIMYDDRSTDTNVQRIASLLTETDTSMKLHALSALSMLGPKAKSAMPEVYKLLHLDDPSLIIGAINAIVSQGEDAVLSVGEFEKALKNVKDPGLRDILRKGLSAVRQAGEPRARPVVDPKK